MTTVARVLFTMNIKLRLFIVVRDNKNKAGRNMWRWHCFSGCCFSKA